MGKYALVASHYDYYRREYLNEIVIHYQNIDFTKLENIDAFTSSLGEMEVMKKIKEENTLTNQNHISIRYLKGNDMKPNYLKVIYNNSLICSMAREVTCQKISYRDFSNAVPMDINFYLEFKKLQEMVELKDIQRLVDFFGPSHSLIALIKQSLNVDIYDHEGIEDIVQKLQTEFSRYKTFRRWIIFKQHVDKKKRTFHVIPPKQEKIVSKSILEHVQDYEKEFQQKYGITYGQHLVNQHNLRCLEEEQEEFLEKEELEQMGYQMRYTRN